jgi:lipopolysaccharide export system protein LptA
MFHDGSDASKAAQHNQCAIIAFVLCAALSFAPCAAHAQSEAQSQADGDQANLPIEIQSNNLEFLRSQNVATFKGDVVAQQGELMITAETLILHFTESADGQKLNEIFGEGGVSISQGEGTATGAALHYPLESGFATLSGDVEVREGPSTFTGDRATFNVETGNSVLEGSVKAVFIPDARIP